MKKFVAIDIETTGLDKDKDQILEIAGVFYSEDLDKPLEFRTLIYHDRIEGNPFALAMNYLILKEISQLKGADKIDIASAMELFSNWLTKCFGEEKVVFAGKNVANFDLPFLLKNGLKVSYAHRIIDVGSMYFDSFGYVPSLDEINVLLGRKAVTHRALDDAKDVVNAIQKKVTKRLVR
jgi:oligoribonuclease (3'-5' exoribonuclease)